MYFRDRATCHPEESALSRLDCAPQPMDFLPIDPLLPDIVGAMSTCGAVVVEAPPGAGKTTRVPRALWAARAKTHPDDEIWVLQPRRLPARLAAKRVAEESGEALGESVGYSVRFEDVSSARTRVRFVTEGILIRRLIENPTLRGISTVVLDEFHERHLASDLALTLLYRLKRSARPDLGLCVMSATLDAQPVADFLDACPRVRSEGRRFDVDFEYTNTPDARPLQTQVASAVRRLLKQIPLGDLLVFLPGAGDIRRCQGALAEIPEAPTLDILPLHGDLPLEGQARVVARSSRRKVILATNVAETSVTIDGVSIVIDSGLAKIAGHSPWTGLSTLALGKISQASAIQRAGRAGRTGPGLAVRLYSEHDFLSRRPFDLPEVSRLDLAELALTTRAVGIDDLSELDWLTPPPDAALSAANELLKRLGAIDSAGRSGKLTARGRSMLRFPLHPRLARLVLAGEERGVGADAAVLAALISEKDIRERGARFDGGRAAGRANSNGGDGIDLLALMEWFESARAARFAPGSLRSLGLDQRATAVVEQTRKQLSALLSKTREPRAAGDRAAQDRALAQSVLTAFPDRVARRRDRQSNVVVLATGGTAELGYVADSEFVVAVNAEALTTPGRPSGGKAGAPTIRLGCGIDSDWLADLDGSDLQASESLSFDAATERVVQRSRLSYGTLVLDETVRPAPPSPETAALLAEAAVSRGAAAFEGEEAVGSLAILRGRLAVLAKSDPSVALPALDDSSLSQVLAGACEGLRSFAELREVGIATRIEMNLSSSLRAALTRDAPTHCVLPGGRRVAIQYPVDQAPWIESRLQDFFGMSEGPTVARGRVPLTLHLLAPNARAMQVTGDLRSFWKQHYPAIRRELQRRYPRHAWPEDGATATPPPPLPPRAPRRR